MKLIGQERIKRKLLDRYRKKSGYDCVVPGSGAKTVPICTDFQI